MRQPAPRPISGHVFKRKGKRGVVWYAKFRLPDGQQQKKRLGPAWTEKTTPPDGYFTKGKAQAHLDEMLRQVWGEEWVGETQTLYVHIRWLREKIESDPGRPSRLLTVRGAGYKLVAPESSA